MAVAARKTRAKKAEDGFVPKVKEKAVPDAYGFSKIQLTPTQKEFANKIIQNDMVVCSAPSGTGKTLTALHTFVKMYLQDPSKQIVIVRTPVESGMDRIGFLPDSLSSKLVEHFSSARALLNKLLTKGKVDTDMEHRIHFKIPNYMLGSTFDNTLLVIDETQEIPPKIIKLILERVGVHSKVVVLGDPSQRYADEKGRNGLNDVIDKFFVKTKDGYESKFSGVDYHRFEIDDVQRSDFCKTVLRAYQ
jgi:phosphate starvation-inducible PhoH-like protein